VAVGPERFARWGNRRARYQHRVRNSFLSLLQARRHHLLELGRRFVPAVEQAAYRCDQGSQGLQ
jgi:hypothetical protein